MSVTEYVISFVSFNIKCLKQQRKVTRMLILTLQTKI